MIMSIFVTIMASYFGGESDFSLLQSNQMKRTPQGYINEFII